VPTQLSKAAVPVAVALTDAFAAALAVVRPPAGRIRFGELVNAFTNVDDYSTAGPAALLPCTTTLGFDPGSVGQSSASGGSHRLRGRVVDRESSRLPEKSVSSP